MYQRGGLGVPGTIFFSDVPGKLVLSNVTNSLTIKGQCTNHQMLCGFNVLVKGLNMNVEVYI